MPDNKKQRARQDAARINVHEDYEVHYWTKELGVSKKRLGQLVKKHGVSAEAVRRVAGPKSAATVITGPAFVEKSGR